MGCIASKEIVHAADGNVYEGERNEAGEPEGRGVMWFADGDVYDGEWKAGKREGRGIFRHASGKVDAVCFKQNDPVSEAVRWLADGQRAVRMRDGDEEEEISLEEARQTAERLGLPIPSPLPADANVYEGERNAAGEYEGRGVMKYANGDVYDGEWKAGLMEGRGIMRRADGDVYEGEWKAGEREGRGVLRLANGTAYEGEWKAGEKEGRGVERWADGDVYEGEYKAGKKEGRGIYRWANGNVYEGEYKAGEKEGRGVFRRADGRVYEGEYKAGKKEGRGVLRYASGDVYEGEMKAGRKEGPGVMRYADGAVRTCFFKQDAAVGEGVMWLADGQRAVRLRDKKIEEMISPEEARKSAERLGLPIPSPLPVHKGIPLLAALDEQLVAVLTSGAIKLLRAEFLRADGSEAMLPKLLRRQELERMEEERGVRIFLTPEEAVAALRSFRREVAGLTYGWTSPDHPDVTGEYLSNLRRFLRHPLGEHVTALFWDFPSLPQKPRSKAEDELFSQALKVMGDVYASAFGTTVVRHRSVPARPAELDGEVVILVEKGGGLDGAGAEAQLRSTLGAFENPRYEEGRWRVRFPTHAAAEEAVEAVTAAGALPGAIAVFLFYNGRPYPARGWTTFESAVSTEAIAHLAYFPGLGGKLQEERLPLKVIEIDGEGPRVAEMEDRADEGLGPRIKRVVAAIQDAAFTGKGDKPVVVELFREYVSKVRGALAGSGETPETEYEGERNAAGEYEGRGVLRFADGTVYEGEFKAGRIRGRVVERYPDGTVYEGEWKAGKSEGRYVLRYANGDVYEGEAGRGVMRYAAGVVYEGEFMAGKKEGRGVERYPDGDVYDGEWTAGEYEGRGIYQFADGNVYDGEWKAGEYEGRGIYQFANGNVYDGEWKAGESEGRGVFRYADGDVYDGEWKAGEKEGRGVMRCASGNVLSSFYKQGARVGEGVAWLADGRRAVRVRDGEAVEWISLEEARRTADRLGLPLPSPLPADANVYEGERNEAGEAEGRGVMKYANGDVCEGEWKADEMEGRGVYRYASGEVYEGEWKAGKREGRGVFRYASGNVSSRFYKQDAPVGEGIKWDCFDADAAAKGYHPNIFCDRSGMSPIVGIRYNLIGEPYDLCEAEFEKLSADLKPLYRAIHPGQRSCWRLRDGEAVEWISLEEARRTAERLGLLLPSPLPGA